MTTYRRSTRLPQRAFLGWLSCVGLLLVAPRPITAQEKISQQPASLTYVQLAELVGPIALYPDKLIAIILPASTYPLEVVQADRLVKKNKNKIPEEMIKKLDFDTSILALIHYPQVLDKMSKDLDWTTNLGDAVANQQEEVMASIQRFRAEAMAAGNLVSNDQVRYESKESTITIVSASPTVIYVPAYNPYDVVVEHDHPSTVVTFASGIAVGAWLSYGCNWHSSHIDVDIHHHSAYWGGHHNYGHFHGGVWGPTAGRRAAARTGARAGARAGYRTGRAHGARQGYGVGYRAGQRTSVPRTSAFGRASGVNGSRAASRSGTRSNTARANATNRSGSRSPGSATPRRQARAPVQRSGGQAYGGYKSGRSARSNSSRGARSRGGSGRRGGGRRR